MSPSSSALMRPRARNATNLTLGIVVVLLCASVSHPAHGIAVLLLVVLLVLRLERTGGEG